MRNTRPIKKAARKVVSHASSPIAEAVSGVAESISAGKRMMITALLFMSFLSVALAFTTGVMLPDYLRDLTHATRFAETDASPPPTAKPPPVKAKRDGKKRAPQVKRNDDLLASGQ